MNKLDNTTKEFLKLLESFEYSFTGYDKIWNFIFQMSGQKWVHIHVVLYNGTFYITELINNYPSLEFDAKHNEIREGQFFGLQNVMPINAWLPVLQNAIIYLVKVQNNWLKEATEIQNNFPLKYRKGIVSHHIINKCFAELIDIKKIVGNKNADQIIKFIETNYFRNIDNRSVKNMTANKFFEYCKVAYNAVFKAKKNSTKEMGKDLYKLYADGRHEGLLDIKANDGKEFANWLDGKHPKKTTGGHPWEILRGGNSTHISLRVSRPNAGNDGFIVTLHGDSFSRIKETLAIAIALKKAGLSFVLNNADDVRLRLLAQDYIGIVPVNQSLHRAEQSFDTDAIFDVIYFADIKSKFKIIEPFITWYKLPIIKPIE